MLEAIIGSKTRIKVLTLFLLNPDRKFYVRELARKTGKNINSIRREVGKLESIGLLRSEKVGNLKYFVVNKKMPIYQELRSMVLKTEGVSEILRENLSKLGEVEAAFIYGSFASGEEHSKSDIDLIIVGEVNERKLIPLIRKLEGQLSREINYTLFSSSEFKSRMRKKDPFITNVLEGKKIHILGEPSEI